MHEELNTRVKHHRANELRRRSLVKSLLWRIIGIVWTWVGAYIILLLIPPSRRSAVLIATLIVVYHHSTRMVMYYVYERFWASVSWGRDEAVVAMSRREKVLWSVGTALALALIFFLLLEVSPRIRARQSEGNTVTATGQSVQNGSSAE
jgi:hypothetical protein